MSRRRKSENKMVAPCFTTAMAGDPLAAVAMDTAGSSTSPSVSIL